MLFPFMFYMVEGKKKEANEKNLVFRSEYQEFREERKGLWGL